MNTNDLTNVVLRALLDPDAEFVEVAANLGIPLTQLLEIALGPEVTAAIKALEQLSQIRARALLAQSTHVAIAALERIADATPETPAARETVRKAAAQLLRMADKAAAPGVPDPTTRDESTLAPPPAPSPAPPRERAGERATTSPSSTRLVELEPLANEVARAPSQPHHANGVT